MSSILRMLSNRSAAVAQSFGARAATYDEHADLQRGVAERLARLLPQRASPRVLELGCGTGLFSRHLLARYPDGTFLLTDLAPSMVEQCRRNLEVAEQAVRQLRHHGCGTPDGRGPIRPHRHEHDAALARRSCRGARSAPQAARSRRGADLRHHQRPKLPRVARGARRTSPSHRAPRHPRASWTSSMRSASSLTPTRSASSAA